MVMYNRDGGVGVEGWLAVVEALAEVSMAASTTTIRQHSLGLLTNIVIDRGDVATEELMTVLGEVCVPVCEERITNISSLAMDSLIECQDDVQAELMLSVNLVFKGFLHHMQALLPEDGFVDLWISCLKVSERLLTRNEERPGEEVRACEELRNWVLLTLPCSSFARSCTCPPPGSSASSRSRTLPWS